ncbi:VCBS domain-containing protein [Acinetobacter junii]|nr:VCBS domain-containing protein [Acinetobacter junii]
MTATDLANGFITATLDASAADPVTGEIVIHAEAVDPQGNVDVADADVTVTIDTVPQDLITVITVPEDLNGDGIINAAELGLDGVFEAQVGLGPDAVEGTVVNVNGTDYTVTATDLANGFITATLDASAADPVTGEIVIHAEAVDPQGNVDVADADVTVTVLTTSALQAFDNFDTAVLAPEPLLVQDDASLGSQTYLALVSLAGLDLQLGSESIDFTVGANQEGTATFTYSALIGVDALSDYSLVVQKFDTTTGQWTSIYGGGEADILDLTLLGSTPGVVIEGLEEGQYRAFMTYTGLAGIGLLGTLSGTMDVYDTTQIGGFYTETADGNVITDINTSGETDIVTPTTVVTAVNGQPVTAVDTVINGLYGTLVIDPDGTYTYTPNLDAAGVGQTDVFVYTLTDPLTGDGAQATLTIELSSVNAVDNLAVAQINPEPLLVENDVALGDASYLLTVSVLGLDLQLLGEDAVQFSVDANREGTATFTFDAVLTADLLSDYAIVVQKFDATIGEWVSIGGDNPEASLISLSLIGGTPTAVLEGLDSGDYRAFISYEGLLGAGLGGTLTGTMDVYNPFIIDGYSVVPVSGNVINDTGISGGVDAASGSAIISMVNGVAIDPAGTTINGTYGTLVIDQDGNYTYTPDADGLNLGQVEQFTYTLLDPVTGNTSDAILYVHLDSESVDMTWNDLDPSQPAVINSPLPVDAMDNVESASIDIVYPVTTEVLDNAISYSWLLGVGGLVIGAKEGTTTFTVDPGNITDAIISVDFGSVATVIDGLHVVLTRVNPDGTTTVVADSNDTGVIDLLGIFGSNVQFQIDNLGAGTYELFMESDTLLTALGSVTADITLNHGDITQTPTLEVATVSGNVLTDDDSVVYGAGYTPDFITSSSVVTSVTTEVGVTEAVVVGVPTVISGVYGDLTINSDGTYSYVATADLSNVGKVDSFTYTVTDPLTGRTDTAVLHVQVGSPDVDIAWNVADPSADAVIPAPVANPDTNDATVSMVNSTGSIADTNVFNFATNTSLLNPIKSGSSSGSITVAAGTLSDLTITAEMGSAIAGLFPSYTFTLVNSLGVTVATATETALLDLLGGTTAQVTFGAVQAGTYTLQVSTSGASATNYSSAISVAQDFVNLNQFIPDGQSDWIQGNILSGDALGGVADTFEGSQLYVFNPVSGVYEIAAGQVINTGEGQLVMYTDGSYYYKANDATITPATDVIDYKLVNIDGTIESISSLTIDVTAELNQTFVSTSANDTFTYGNGSDTLIYSVLNLASATGGNTTVGGVDTWTDFHLGDVTTDTQADKIDISNLLDGSQSALTIGQYVDVNYDAASQTVTLLVDRDGGLLIEGTFTETPILQLTNITSEITLQDLLNNGQIIY